MLTCLAIVLAGLGFRLRGEIKFTEWTGRGLTTARIVCWAIPCALLAAAAGHGLWEAVAIGVAAWLGSIAGWWDSLTLGRNKAEGSTLEQWLRHQARGLLWTLPMAAVVAYAGHDPLWLALAGLMCGPAYEFGWRVWPERGTEVGEFVFGAVIGGALVWTM